MSRLRKWFGPKDEGIIELFRNEYRLEYQMARKNRENISNVYVREFLEAQGLL